MMTWRFFIPILAWSKETKNDDFSEFLWSVLIIFSWLKSLSTDTFENGKEARVLTKRIKSWYFHSPDGVFAPRIFNQYSLHWSSGLALSSNTCDLHCMSSLRRSTSSLRYCSFWQIARSERGISAAALDGRRHRTKHELDQLCQIEPGFEGYSQPAESSYSRRKTYPHLLSFLQPQFHRGLL